jgi:hypothetical protein
VSFVTSSSLLLLTSLSLSLPLSGWGGIDLACTSDPGKLLNCLFPGLQFSVRTSSGSACGKPSLTAVQHTMQFILTEEGAPLSGRLLVGCPGRISEIESMHLQLGKLCYAQICSDFLLTQPCVVHTMQACRLNQTLTKCPASRM